MKHIKKAVFLPEICDNNDIRRYIARSLILTACCYTRPCSFFPDGIGIKSTISVNNIDIINSARLCDGCKNQLLIVDQSTYTYSKGWKQYDGCSCGRNIHYTDMTSELTAAGCSTDMKKINSYLVRKLCKICDGHAVMIDFGFAYVKMRQQKITYNWDVVKITEKKRSM